MGIDLYDLPGYRAVADTLYARHPKAYESAYLRLRNECGSFLNEKELRSVLRKIQIHEGKIRDFLSAAWNGVKDFAKGVVIKLMGIKPEDLLREIKNNRAKLAQKAQEARFALGDLDLKVADAHEVYRRMYDAIPPPPDRLVKKFVKVIEPENLQVRESMREEDVLSFTSFFQKWVLLYIFYGVAKYLAGMSGIFTGGAALLGFSLIQLPFLLLMIDDLMYQIGGSEYVAP